jgi:4-amino-4-deoxy-L-arabinose transferase-like glycosyltransferase
MSRRSSNFWLALFGALIVVRIAGFVFGVVNLDEDEFCVIGSMICRGALSYVDIAEFKPPLTHLLFAPAGMFGGVSIWPMRILGLFWAFGICFTAYKAASEWLQDELAGRAAAILVLLALCCEVPATNAELLMDLPLALALLYWVRSEDFLAGLCVGIASLFKHQGAILVGAFGLAAIPRVKRWIPLSAGALLPWLLAAAYWAFRGHLAEFYEWMVLRNFFYAQAASVFSWSNAFAAIAVCVLGCALPWTMAVLGSRKAFSGNVIGRGVVLGLWLTWIPVSAGGRFYEHYFLQFAPQLALIGAPVAAGLWRAQRRKLLVALTVLPLLGYVGYSLARGITGHYPNQDAKVIDVSDWLRGNTAPTDKLFIWGHAPQIYYLSQRPPASRYLTGATQIGGFDPGQLPPGFDVSKYQSARDVKQLVEDLEASKAELFVDTAPAGIHDWEKAPLAGFEPLMSYVQSHYRQVGSPAGAAVYRRN